MNASKNDLKRLPVPFRERGFTVIELLITVALIAVLAVLTVGASVGIIESQKRTKDVSNLRSLGQGLHLYIVDNNQKLPVIASPSPLKTIAVQLGIMKSTTQYDDADFSNMDLDIFGPLISPADPRVRRCPWNSYGSNYYMGSNPAQSRENQNIHTAVRYLEIVNPSRKLYLVPIKTNEGYTGHGRYTEGSSPWKARVGSAAIRFDSKGFTPALFMDGRVAQISLEETSDASAKAPGSWIFPLK